MTDFLGNKLNVGDKVIFVADVNYNATLRKGIVDKIYKNDKECTVSGCSHVYYNRVMKL